MQTLKMDFQSQSAPPVVPVMQSDSQSRFIGITLYNGGVAYEAPEGAQYTVQYCGPGANNTGWYDTIQLSSGTRKAVVVDSDHPNVVTLELAEQALRVNGPLEVNLCVVNNTGYKLNTFPIICRVTGAPYVDPVAVRSYFYVTGITSEQWLAYVTACQDAQKRAEDATAKFETDPTLSVSGKAADAAKVGEAVGQVKEDLDDITQIAKSRNILEIRNYTEGRYYSASSGDYRNSDDFFTVDNYVEVEPSSSYVLSEFIDGVFEKLLSSIIIFYDKNKKYLSGGQYSTFTTPENASYIRFSPNKDAINKQLLLEKGTEPSKIWTPYSRAYVKGEKVINFPYGNIKDKPTINGVEISGNKTSKDYGIPDGSKINEIAVDVNGTGDFERLQDAIESIAGNSKNNRFIIYIKEGNYDLAEDITDGENDSAVIGVTIPNWVTLRGLGNRENIILKAKFTNKMHYVSTLNFQETGAIENLTVIGENTRYTIHDDFARKSSGYKRNVKHCIIKGVTTYYSTVYGAGTGDGADWEFEDVIFDGSQVGANSKPANTFTVHNVLTSQKNRSIVFKNCIFVSSNEKNVKFKTLAYRTSTGADNANNMLTNVSLYGCKFDGTNKGFELVEENPDVYGKGCYYWVNGYGNVNAGYEITTTDNKDYSNRVNLI